MAEPDCTVSAHVSDGRWRCQVGFERLRGIFFLIITIVEDAKNSPKFASKHSSNIDVHGTDVHSAMWVAPKATDALGLCVCVCGRHIAMLSGNIFMHYALMQKEIFDNFMNQPTSTCLTRKLIKESFCSCLVLLLTPEKKNPLLTVQYRSLLPAGCPVTEHLRTHKRKCSNVRGKGSCTSIAARLQILLARTVKTCLSIPEYSRSVILLFDIFGLSAQNPSIFWCVTFTTSSLVSCPLQDCSPQKSFYNLYFLVIFIKN